MGILFKRALKNLIYVAQIYMGVDEMAKKINMTLEEVKAFLAEYHDENRAKIYVKHEESTEGEFLGIKIADLKKVLKMTKKNYELSKQLFDTGVYDYMYLAGLMGDEKLMTKEEACHWIEHAKYNTVAEYAVSWLVSETPYAIELAAKYVDSDIDREKAIAWSIYSNHLALTEDDNIDKNLIFELLGRVERTIHDESNRCKYCMNNFVIAVAAFYEPLLEESKFVADNIYKVDVYVGKTSCKVPYAVEYIKKLEDKNKIGKKKKTVRC